MFKFIKISLIGLIGSGFAVVPAPAQDVDPAMTGMLLMALMLLLPLGLILLISSATPEPEAPATAVNLLVIWAGAVLAYFAVGFAFQFGGIAQVSAQPDLSGLYWEWYPLDQSVDVEVARQWGVIALQGWALGQAAATPGALHLFGLHGSLVGVAAMIPAAVLLRRRRSGTALLTGLLIGGIVYPVAGNWLWGGGWLFQLGRSLGWGHGLIDFGGASLIFLNGSLVALVALLLFKPTHESTTYRTVEEVVVSVGDDSSLTVYNEPEFVESPETLPATPMPSAYLPLLGILGAGLMLLGWLGLAAGAHIPTAVAVWPAQAAVNGLLAALSAAFTAAAYSWFTTYTFNPLMTARGLVAGLVVAAAGAPFMPAWLPVGAGLLMGLALPPLIYFCDQKWGLADELGLLATFGLSALTGLLLVGWGADGRAGQGWNGVGLTEFGGVPGQGVAGLIVAGGFTSDWPGQVQAQLLGLVAIGALAVVTATFLFQTVKAITRSWIETGLEFTRPTFQRPGATAETPGEETTGLEPEQLDLDQAGT